MRKDNSDLQILDDPDTRWSKPLDLFAEKRFVKICAPMVRYSKLPFRLLARQYGCDLAFTPMIVSNSFVQSIQARNSDFTTCKDDRPLVVQFAANNAKDFSHAAEIVAPFSDGVDLNCGCPQRWALAEGYGACLIHKPEIVRDIICQTRARVPQPDFTISLKIRIHCNLRETIDFCQKMEQAGLSWLTVHGRTKEQRYQPVNLEAIRLIKENLSIPVVANGDIRTLHDSREVQDKTSVDGVMAARGMLHNPAMFTGSDLTPARCVSDWIRLALSVGTPFQIFHHHLTFMLEKILSRPERVVFSSLASTSAVLDFLEENYRISASGKPTS